MIKVILIVQDQAIISQILQQYLTQYNYIVDVVSSGNQAINKLDNSEYDLIISDIQLPDIDGIQILKYAKSKNINSKFIMISGYYPSHQIMSYIMQTVDAFLRKPFGLDKLLETIHKISGYQK